MQKTIYIFLILFALQLSAQESNRETIEVTEEAYKELLGRAEYPGGGEALARFLRSTIEYPAAAIEKKSKGKVIVRFTIEKNGSLSEFKTLLDHVGYGAPEEVIKALKKTKQWKPARVDGKPVRSYYQISVSFVLPKQTE